MDRARVIRTPANGQQKRQRTSSQITWRYEIDENQRRVEFIAIPRDPLFLKAVRAFRYDLRFRGLTSKTLTFEVLDDCRPSAPTPAATTRDSDQEEHVAALLGPAGSRRRVGNRDFANRPSAVYRNPTGA